MSTKPASREDSDEQQDAPAGADHKPGTNEVEHEPDPKAEPLPDGQHKHVPRSPYTTGNY